MIDIWNFSSQIALSSKQRDLFNYQSTLAQVIMAIYTWNNAEQILWHHTKISCCKYCLKYSVIYYNIFLAEFGLMISMT